MIHDEETFWAVKRTTSGDFSGNGEEQIDWWNGRRHEFSSGVYDRAEFESDASAKSFAWMCRAGTNDGVTYTIVRVTRRRIVKPKEIVKPEEKTCFITKETP